MPIASEDTTALIHDIANREGTASQLAKWYECTVDELRSFVDTHRVDIEIAAQSNVDIPGTDVTPEQLDDLWITNKFERLKRLQDVAELAYGAIQRGGYGDATLVREFRSYLMLAANELGQLLHRGSGDGGAGDVASFHVEGVNLESLK